LVQSNSNSRGGGKRKNMPKSWRLGGSRGKYIGVLGLSSEKGATRSITRTLEDVKTGECLDPTCFKKREADDKRWRELRPGGVNFKIGD